MTSHMPLSSASYPTVMDGQTDVQMFHANFRELTLPKIINNIDKKIHYPKMIYSYFYNTLISCKKNRIEDKTLQLGLLLDI